MIKKKIIYLSLIITLITALTSLLFYRKSKALRTEAVAEELQKALLPFIEKEEVYPKSLKNIIYESRGLNVKYEYLKHGSGCRFIIEGKIYELWDEER